MTILIIVLVWLFLITGGSIYFMRYVFAWNPFYEGALGLSKTWIWIGTRDEYGKHLDREKKRIENREKDRLNKEL